MSIKLLQQGNDYQEKVDTRIINNPKNICLILNTSFNQRKINIDSHCLKYDKTHKRPDKITSKSIIQNN